MARSKAQLIQDSTGAYLQRNRPFTVAENLDRDLEEAEWRAGAAARTRKAKISAQLAVMDAEKRAAAEAFLIARGDIT